MTKAEVTIILAITLKCIIFDILIEILTLTVEHFQVFIVDACIGGINRWKLDFRICQVLESCSDRCNTGLGHLGCFILIFVCLKKYFICRTFLQDG